VKRAIVFALLATLVFALLLVSGCRKKQEKTSCLPAPSVVRVA